MDLSSLSTSTFTPPARWPAGHYRVQIVKAELLPFEWKNKGVTGLMYVPTIQPVSFIPSGDDAVDAELQAALDAYGDWTHREFQFAYTRRDDNKRLAQVSEINFPLVETDSDGEVVGIIERQAARWHVTPEHNNGVEGGFIHDVLGMSYPQGGNILEITEATIGKFFIVNMEYEPNQDESRPPNLVIARGGVARDMG